MLRATLRCMNKGGSDFLTGKTVGEAVTHFKSSKVPFVDNIIENQSYKSFFADFDKEAKGKRITSFEEQKSFNQMLQFLTQTQNKSVVDSLHSEFGTSSDVYNHTGSTQGSLSPRKYSFFGKKAHPINLETRHEQRTKARRALETALAPTFLHITKTLTTSKQMYDFITTDIINTFVNADAKSPPLNAEQIEQMANKTPATPPVTRETLPCLLHFCLRSLIVDFRSFELAQSVVRLIKNHPNIDLYSHGMDIDMYNLIIRHTWHHTGNLHSISLLVDELRANALPHDLETYQLIALIYLRCFALGKSVAGDSIAWARRPDIYSLKAYLDSVVVL